MGFFKSKKEKELIKREQEIENKLKEIETQKKMLEKEKESLLKIKEMMENTNNPDYIDISNVCVLEKTGIYSLIEVKTTEATGENEYGVEVEGFKSIITNIFTKKVIYDMFHTDGILGINNVKTGNNLYDVFVVTSIYKYDRNLLVYADKKVPRYILLQLYYELNDIDITKPEMQKYIKKNTD